MARKMITSGDTIRPAADPFGTTTATYTISCWAKFPTASVGMNLSVAWNGGAGDSAWLFQVTSADKLFVVYRNNLGHTTILTCNTTLIAKRWYHFAGVYDCATTNTVKGYVNGVQDGTIAAADSATLIQPISTMVIGIGSLGTPTDQSFNKGSVAYFSLWNRVLREYEIRKDMFEPGSIPQGLQGHWPLCTSDKVEVDFSTRRRNATVIGSRFDNDDPLVDIVQYKKPYNYGFPYPISKKKRRFPRLDSVGITFDAASNSGYQAAASSYNWNHTCTGNSRYLTVGISMLSLAQTVSSITYNSVNLVFLGSQSSITGAARVELWGLVNPTSGTNSIAVTLTGAIASAGNASSYTNVHQTSPTEGFNSAQATNVGAADATVSVTTVADNDFCVDIIATDDASITVGANQTQTGNVTGAGGSGAMSYEGKETPPGAFTMSWTNVGALATWAIGSIALRPVGSSSLLTGTLLNYPGLTGRMQQLQGNFYG